MAYRIRYGWHSGRPIRNVDGLKLRIFASGFLTGLICLIRLFGNPVAELLKSILDHAPLTLTERAVSDMATALSAGEGWYHAMVVWCNAVLFGSV